MDGKLNLHKFVLCSKLLLIRAKSGMNCCLTPAVRCCLLNVQGCGCGTCAFAWGGQSGCNRPAPPGVRTGLQVPIQTYDDLDNPLLPGMEPRSYVKIGRSECICWDKASTVCLCTLGWRLPLFNKRQVCIQCQHARRVVLVWPCLCGSAGCVCICGAASVVLHLLCRATSHVSISSPLLVLHVLHKVAWFPQA